MKVLLIPLLLSVHAARAALLGVSVMFGHQWKLQVEVIDDATGLITPTNVNMNHTGFECDNGWNPVIQMDQGALALILDSCVLTFADELVLRVETATFLQQSFLGGIMVPSDARISVTGECFGPLTRCHAMCRIGPKPWNVKCAIQRTTWRCRPGSFGIGTISAPVGRAATALPGAHPWGLAGRGAVGRGGACISTHLSI